MHGVEEPSGTWTTEGFTVLGILKRDEVPGNSAADKIGPDSPHWAAARAESDPAPPRLGFRTTPRPCAIPQYPGFRPPSDCAGEGGEDGHRANTDGICG